MLGDCVKAETPDPGYIGFGAASGVQSGMTRRSQPRVSRPPVVALNHFRRGVSLQIDRTKIVAQQSTDGNVALLLIIADRTREVGRTVGHPSKLPLAKLLGRRQVNIEEIWVTAVYTEAQ